MWTTNAGTNTGTKTPVFLCVVLKVKHYLRQLSQKLCFGYHYMYPESYKVKESVKATTAYSMYGF